MFTYLHLRRASRLALAGMLLIIPSCSSSPPKTPGPAKLVPFSSPEELLDYFREQASDLNRRGGPLLFGGQFNWPSAPGAGDAAGSAEGSESFTTTNLQEPGVDESDLVKCDGTYLYIAKADSLRIVRATPRSEMAEIGRLDLDVHIHSMYLLDSKVILLGQRHSYGPPGGIEILMWPPYYPASELTVYEVDVADPTVPQITGQIELDGSLVTSRLTNGRLIVVMTSVPELPENPTRTNIADMTLEEVLPGARWSGGEGIAVDYSDVFHPVVPNGFYLLTVVTLDAHDVETMVASTAVMASAGTIYASPQALYLTDTDYDPDDHYRAFTAVHKLAFDSQGAAKYTASGSVPGRLLNQFSLGEYEGYLRLATHVSDPGFSGPFNSILATPPEPYNAVYVLAEAADKLEVVGSIEDIAPGEQIYAARFLGKRGFLVTFEQIDPLFVIDLGDPQHPQVLGMLEIPGYSDYLHLFDEDHLIGVGRSVRPAPWGGVLPDAVQLSLFDVADWAHPALVQQVEIGGPNSISDVSFTHKAFTLLAEEGLLAIPAQLQEDSSEALDYLPEFVGVLCFHVDPTAGFADLGRLECVNGDPFGYFEWRRGAFIGDGLYAVSPAGVRAAPLADLTDDIAITLDD